MVDLVAAWSIGRIEDGGRGHLHLANPNRPYELLRELLFRLRLHNKAHVDGDAGDVAQGEAQNSVGDGTASNVHVNLEVVRSPVIVTRQRLPQQARAVIPHRFFHNPRPLHDPVHQLEPLVPERVIALDEPPQERTGGNRFVREKVEYRAVVLFPWHLKVHSEDEALTGLALGLGLAEGLAHTVVGPTKDVVELRLRFEPVHSGRRQ